MNLPSVPLFNDNNMVGRIIQIYSVLQSFYIQVIIIIVCIYLMCIFLVTKNTTVVGLIQIYSVLW